eukprot:4959502-Karenia_brevis.AAC.1
MLQPGNAYMNVYLYTGACCPPKPPVTLQPSSAHMNAYVYRGGLLPHDHPPLCYSQAVLT